MDRAVEITNQPTEAWPRQEPVILRTAAGTPYLRDPGVALIAKPQFNPMALLSFIEGFADVFGESAAADYMVEMEEAKRQFGDGPMLVMAAGQLCYLSYGEKRTKAVDVVKYLDHILSSGHGSVLEHANYTIHFWGVDRAFTHEIVRHRAGFGFSQVSQRYVDGKALRFVEDFEHQDDPDLHAQFERWIDMAKHEYDVRAQLLQRSYEAHGKLEGLSKTDARKKVNQAARRCLPNETEAPIVVTGNVRAWRNFLDQRASVHADVGIRRPAFITGMVLRAVAMPFFADYVEDLKTGTMTPKYRKV